MEIARDAWASFRSPNPESITPTQQDALPFLAAALRRHLEEFPWLDDGLARSERQILDALRPQPLPFGRLFAATREEPAYLGDAILEWYLRRMQAEGLVERRGELWAFKSAERKTRVPRWLGGVLVDEKSPWRWDAAKGRLLELF